MADLLRFDCAVDFEGLSDPFFFLEPFAEVLLRESCLLRPDLSFEPLAVGELDRFLSDLSFESLLSICLSSLAVLLMSPEF